MIDEVPEAEPEDSVDEYRDHYDDVAKMLHAAAQGLVRTAEIVDDSVEAPDTVAEANALIEERVDEELTREQHAAIEAIANGAAAVRDGGEDE